MLDKGEGVYGRGRKKDIQLWLRLVQKVAEGKPLTR